MTFKKGVSIIGVKPELITAFLVVDSIYKKEGFDLVITSVSDGKHGVHSLHKYGYAFDIRVWGMDTEKIKKIAEKIRQALTHEFQVIIEKDHIHIELELRK